MTSLRNNPAPVLLLLLPLFASVACDDSGGGSLGSGGFGQRPNQNQNTNPTTNPTNATTTPGVIPPTAASLIGTWSAMVEDVTAILALTADGEAATLLYTGTPPRFTAAEASVGTFSVSGDRLVLRALRSSCPGTLDDPVSEFTFQQTGNSLSLRDDQGTLTFTRRPDEVVLPDDLGCIEDSIEPGSPPPGGTRGN